MTLIAGESIARQGQRWWQKLGNDSRLKVLVYEKRLPEIWRSRSFSTPVAILRAAIADLAEMWEELSFDIRLGTDTCRIVPVERLDIEDAKRRAVARRSRPTPVYRVRRALMELRGRASEIEKSVLVDYGCGAGRILLVALEAGFREVVGVDLSADEIKRCGRNLTHVERTRPIKFKWDLTHGDASQFQIPPEARVFFFYHPFDSIPTWEKILGRIRDVAEQAGEPVYVLEHSSHFFARLGFEFLTEVEQIRIHRHDPRVSRQQHSDRSVT
jgi:hypothetical protein